jgi:hypothetical protein
MARITTQTLYEVAELEKENVADTASRVVNATKPKAASTPNFPSASIDASEQVFS